MLKAELFYYNGADLLESPVWDAKTGIVYTIEIRKNRIYGISTADRSCRTYDTGSVVGWIFLKRDGNLLLGKKEGIFTMNVKSGEFTYLVHAEPDLRMRYNDGTLDRRGRVLIGTKGDSERMEGCGGLFSVEDGGRVRKIISGVTVSNGVGFSPDGSVLYYIDTPTGKVDAFDYCQETGEPSNRRTIVELADGGLPDGLCVDREGMLWVAEFGGGKVCRWSPDGRLLETVGLPCAGVTACCFGGVEMDELFITTAKIKGKDEPLAGGLFRVRVF